MGARTAGSPLRTGDEAARRAGVRLVAANRPGYGRSDPHESGHLSVADDTSFVASLLGVERFAVLGMSVGGPYALACAARHPDRLTAAGVVAGPAPAPELDPPFPRDDLPASQQQFFTRLAAGSVAEAVDMVRPEFEDYVARVAPKDGSDADLTRRLLQQLPRRTPGWWLPSRSQTSRPRSEKRWLSWTGTCATPR